MTQFPKCWAILTENLLMNTCVMNMTEFCTICFDIRLKCSYIQFSRTTITTLDADMRTKTERKNSNQEELSTKIKFCFDHGKRRYIKNDFSNR